MEVATVGSQRRAVLRVIVSRNRIDMASLTGTAKISRIAVHRSLGALRGLDCLHHTRNFTISLSDSSIRAHVVDGCALGHRLTRFTTSLIRPNRAVFVRGNDDGTLLTQALNRRGGGIAVVAIDDCVTRLLGSTPYRIVLLNNICRGGDRDVINPLAHRYVRRIRFDGTFVNVSN